MNKGEEKKKENKRGGAVAREAFRALSVSNVFDEGRRSKGGK